jgi:glycosyltransferase involved in cell wall biosynthesis
VRIALVVHQYLPEHVGGTEVYTWSLAQALQSLGHELVVFVPDGRLSADRQENLDSHLVWRAPISPMAKAAGPLGLFWRTFRNPATEDSYVRMLRVLRPQVIHVQHLQNVSAKLLSLSVDRPVFLTLHDYWFRCATGQLVRVDGSVCDGPSVACAVCALARTGSNLPRALRPVIALPIGYRNAYLDRVLAQVNRFIAPSAFVRDTFVRWGMEPERITTLANGVDHGRLGRQRSADPQDSRTTTFGYLGAIAPTKGVHVLIQAFEGLPAKVPLNIYGDLGVFPQYTRQLLGMARHPGIRLLGSVPQGEIGDALRSVDYLVIPSLTPESYSMVLDEARALGVPVIASRIGALSRLQDGVEGRLFEAGNVSELHAVLEDLILHRDLRRQYATALPHIPTIGEQAVRLSEMYGDVMHRRLAPHQVFS